MPQYANTLQFLYSLQTFGIKLGLGNTEVLLDSLGNPHRNYFSIHVAGTNGKGSTAAMIASVLTAAGFKTGLYTSPHLIDFSERIRVNGLPIPIDAVVAITELLRPKVETLRATFFEVTTAMAFQYFSEQRVDVAVVETGMGGRLDATNVLHPILSMITSIGLDHVEHLGRDLKSVAREKGGIIKANTPCVIGKTPQQALDILREIATKKCSTLVNCSRAASHRIREDSLDRLVSDFTVFGRSYPRVKIGLLGRHQVLNATCALVCLELLRRFPELPFAGRLTERVARRGLTSVSRNTGLRGRLEVLARRPTVVIDVAHNPDAIKALNSAMRGLGLTKLIVVFGVMKDKDLHSMLRVIKPSVKLLVAVRAETERSRATSDVVRECLRMRINAMDGEDVPHGVQLALEQASASDTVLIVGSHYVVGEALNALEQGGEALDNRNGN